MCQEPPVPCNAKAFQSALDRGEGHAEVSTAGAGSGCEADDVTDVESHKGEPWISEGSGKDAAYTGMGLQPSPRGAKSTRQNSVFWWSMPCSHSMNT